jgi:hypothetical protein
MIKEPGEYWRELRRVDHRFAVLEGRHFRRIGGHSCTTRLVQVVDFRIEASRSRRAPHSSAVARSRPTPDPPGAAPSAESPIHERPFHGAMLTEPPTTTARFPKPSEASAASCPTSRPPTLAEVFDCIHQLRLKGDDDAWTNDSFDRLYQAVFLAAMDAIGSEGRPAGDGIVTPDRGGAYRIDVAIGPRTYALRLGLPADASTARTTHERRGSHPESRRAEAGVSIGACEARRSVCSP